MPCSVEHIKHNHQIYCVTLKNEQYFVFNKTVFYNLLHYVNNFIIGLHYCHLQEQNVQKYSYTNSKSIVYKSWFYRLHGLGFIFINGIYVRVCEHVSFETYQNSVVSKCIRFGVYLKTKSVLKVYCNSTFL